MFLAAFISLHPHAYAFLLFSPSPNARCKIMVEQYRFHTPFSFFARGRELDSGAADDEESAAASVFLRNRSSNVCLGHICEHLRHRIYSLKSKVRVALRPKHSRDVYKLCGNESFIGAGCGGGGDGELREEGGGEGK